MDDDSIGRLILPEEQIELLRAAWDKVLAQGEETAGVRLFKNIFDMSSEAAKLFSFIQGSDTKVLDFATLAGNPQLVKHAVGVIRTVTTVIYMLEEDELIAPTLRDLGARHHLYSVKPEHYAIVGSAFYKTVRQALGIEYTEQVGEAFTALWNEVIAMLMQDSDAETVRQAQSDLMGFSQEQQCEDEEESGSFISMWTKEFMRLDSQTTQACNEDAHTAPNTAPI